MVQKSWENHLGFYNFPMNIEISTTTSTGERQIFWTTQTKNNGANQLTFDSNLPGQIRLVFHTNFLVYQKGVCQVGTGVSRIGINLLICEVFFGPGKGLVLRIQIGALMGGSAWDISPSSEWYSWLVFPLMSFLHFFVSRKHPIWHLSATSQCSLISLAHILEKSVVNSFLFTWQSGEWKPRPSRLRKIVSSISLPRLPRFDLHPRAAWFVFPPFLSDASATYETQSNNKNNPGCLCYKIDYTTRLYGDLQKPL